MSAHGDPGVVRGVHAVARPVRVFSVPFRLAVQGSRRPCLPFGQERTEHRGLLAVPGRALGGLLTPLRVTAAWGLEDTRIELSWWGCMIGSDRCNNNGSPDGLFPQRPGFSLRVVHALQGLAPKAI